MARSARGKYMRIPYRTRKAEGTSPHGTGEQSPTGHAGVVLASMLGT